MDELITDQIEWLLTANSGTLRMGRSIMTLAGFLSDGSLPEQIDRQLADLSRQVMLQELLDSLIQSLNTIFRTYGVVSQPPKEGDRIDTPEFGKLLDQIEATRQDLAAHSTVNYSALISWLVKQARDRKLLSKRARR